MDVNVRSKTDYSLHNFNIEVYLHADGGIGKNSHSCLNEISSKAPEASTASSTKPDMAPIF